MQADNSVAIAGAVAIAGINLPPELHAFVRLVLAREDLQERLGAEFEAKAFVNAAMAVAAENGIALDPEILRGVLRPDPAGIGRFGPAPVEMAGWPPRGWLPTRSVPSPDGLAFDWLWCGSRPLQRPFFEEDVRTAAVLPLNWLLRIRTRLDGLVGGAQGQPGLPLGGLIFHMSRCGSTLAAQMLGAVSGHAVLSEPEPLDAILRWCAESGASPEQAHAAIHAMIAALGRDRGQGAHVLFIKMEVWHTLFLPLLRQALPAVNWIYLHRNPAEVLVSLEAMPSHHIVPSVIPEGYFGPAGLAGLEYHDYAPFALGHFAAAVPRHWDLGGGMVLDYPDIAAALPTRVARHFGLQLGTAELAAMEQAATFDAKAPGKPFVPDTARKRAAAGPAIQAAAAQWLDPVRQSLLTLGARQ